MFNRVILLGNLTRDVELRYLPSGSALAKIGLATNRRYKKQDGSPTEEVCFIDVNLFGRTAEVANQYLKRGSKVLIEGRLVLESWTDQSGQKRSKHSITAESMQMLDNRPQMGGGFEQPYDGGYGADSYMPATNYNPPYGGGQQNSQQSHGGFQDNSYMENTSTGRQSRSKPKAIEQEEAYNNKIPEIDVDEDDIPF